MLLEPLALAVHALRERAEWPGGLEVGAGISPRTLRASFVGTALAACLVGLLGVAGGMLWIIGGVWTVRRVWGAPLGLAWGIALLAAGVRWGSLGLADLQAATRTLGPTLAVEPTLVAAGAGVALTGALLGEAAAGGLRATGIAERAAAGVALLALVPAYLAPGFGHPTPLVSLGWWGGAAAASAVIVLAAAPLARRLPGWLPATIAAAGALMVGAGW